MLQQYRNQLGPSMFCTMRCVVCEVLVICIAFIPPNGSAIPADTWSRGTADQTGLVQSSLHISRLSIGSRNVNVARFPSVASNNCSIDVHSSSVKFEY